jgi:hypothetical protein
MVVTAATNCSLSSAHVQAALAKRREAAEAGIRARIKQGIRDGELPPDTDAAALANFYTTVFQGMSIQARDGATRANLLAIARTALRAWPVDEPAASEARPAEAKARAKRPARVSA